MLKKIAERLWQVIRNERGEFVGTIGWMAVTAAILVIIHGAISGWLPNFIQNIFNRMETLV